MGKLNTKDKEYAQSVDRRALFMMEWCKQKGMVKTDKEFCEKIKFFPGNLPKIQRGQSSFRVFNLMMICKLTGCSMDYLAGLQGEIYSEKKEISGVDMIKEGIRILENAGKKGKNKLS